MLMAYGWLPPGGLIDKAAMESTLNSVWQNWDLQSTWGGGPEASGPRPIHAAAPSVTARLTMGMYSAKVGAGVRSCGAVSRSAGETPSRDSSSRAASRSAELAGEWVGMTGLMIAALTVDTPAKRGRFSC
jgi:hypothetical protein